MSSFVAYIACICIFTTVSRGKVVMEPYGVGCVDIEFTKAAIDKGVKNDLGGFGWHNYAANGVGKSDAELEKLSRSKLGIQCVRPSLYFLRSALFENTRLYWFVQGNYLEPKPFKTAEFVYKWSRIGLDTPAEALAQGTLYMRGLFVEVKLDLTLFHATKGEDPGGYNEGQVLKLKSAADAAAPAAVVAWAGVEPFDLKGTVFTGTVPTAADIKFSQTIRALVPNEGGVIWKGIPAKPAPGGLVLSDAVKPALKELKIDIATSQYTLTLKDAGALNEIVEDYEKLLHAQNGLKAYVHYAMQLVDHVTTHSEFLHYHPFYLRYGLAEWLLYEVVHVEEMVEDNDVDRGEFIRIELLPDIPRLTEWSHYPKKSEWRPIHIKPNAFMLGTDMEYTSFEADGKSVKASAKVEISIVDELSVSIHLTAITGKFKPETHLISWEPQRGYMCFMHSINNLLNKPKSVGCKALQTIWDAGVAAPEKGMPKSAYKNTDITTSGLRAREVVLGLTTAPQKPKVLFLINDPKRKGKLKYFGGSEDFLAAVENLQASGVVDKPALGFLAFKDGHVFAVRRIQSEMLGTFYVDVDSESSTGVAKQRGPHYVSAVVVNGWINDRHDHICIAFPAETTIKPGASASGMTGFSVKRGFKAYAEHGDVLSVLEWFDEFDDEEEEEEKEESQSHGVSLLLMCLIVVSELYVLCCLIGAVFACVCVYICVRRREQRKAITHFSV